MRRVAAVTAIVGSLVAVGLRARQAPPAADARPALESVLQAAGAYLSGYGPALSAIVAEETYGQNLAGRDKGARRLRSDLLFFMDGPYWAAFRDVFEVDGQNVRDRDDRIAKLLGPGSTPDARAQAQRIAAESARFNLNVQGVSVARTLNVPIAALLFFLSENQHRSRFKIERMDVVGDAHVAVVAFDERTTPRLIASQDHVAMHGHAWIEPSSGRILRTDLRYVTYGTPYGSRNQNQMQTVASLAVTFTADPRLGLAVPASMDERYEATLIAAPNMPPIPGLTPVLQQGLPAATLVGHATYANFRRFGVSVGTTIDR